MTRLYRFSFDSGASESFVDLDACGRLYLPVDGDRSSISTASSLVLQYFNAFSNIFNYLWKYLNNFKNLVRKRMDILQ